MSLLALAGVGLALGIKHATFGDHVVAFTALAARDQRIGPAALVGISVAAWAHAH